HCVCLLLGRLDWDKAHRRPQDCFADRLRIGCVVLAALHIGFHIRWRHQLHLMPERYEFPSPIMRARAGLNPDRAGRELGEELQYCTAPQLLPYDDTAQFIYPMHLEDMLRQIQTDRANLTHGRLLSFWRLLTTTFWHIDAVSGGRPPHQTAHRVQTRLRDLAARFARGLLKNVPSSCYRGRRECRALDAPAASRADEKSTRA